MHLDVPDLDHKRPIYYDVIEGKPFTFTSESSRVLTQMELWIFLKGGQLWALEEYWTQVCVLVGHSASTADFNWSAGQISICCLLDVCRVKSGWMYRVRPKSKMVMEAEVWCSCHMWSRKASIAQTKVMVLLDSILCCFCVCFFCRGYCIIYSCGWWNIEHPRLLVKGHMQRSFLWSRSGEVWASISGKENILGLPAAHCGRDVFLSKGFVIPTSPFLGVSGGDATNICPGGANLDFIKALDKSSGQKEASSTRWVQHRFSLNNYYTSSVSACCRNMTCFPCFARCCCASKCYWLNVGFSRQKFSEG